ncbi:hypothetical protein [Thermococcus sp.]|uniref:hypothetical protein n=1 Tax=Thermococcus sp. TaxID=35749 RepID=UPI002618DBBA|nr:hypothetical protein [Thermococcus sp.]
MLEVILLVLYLIAVIVIGIRLYFRADYWTVDLERILPTIDTKRAVLYAILGIVIASFLEIIPLFLLHGSPLMLAAVFPLFVGFVEEGVKLIPYLVERGDVLRRWNLTIKTAFMFALIEAVLYGITLFLAGNFLGAVLRVVVIMFHVTFTAIALASALRGSIVRGYLKAALLHGFYDAPIFGFLSGNRWLEIVFTLLGLGAVLYTYLTVDDAFEIAHDLGLKAIEERKRRTREFWEERGIELDDLNPLP